MSRRKYHDHLRAVPLFSQVDKHDLDVIDSAITTLSFPAGEVLMREGSTAREMVIVVDGELSVSRDGEEIATIGPGGFAGEMGLLTDHRRSATVSAKTDVHILHIDARAFDSVLQEAPQVAVAMLPIVASRVLENNEHHTH